MAEPTEHYEGTVTSVRRVYFDATIVSLTRPSCPVLIATIRMDAIPDTEREMVSVGAVFDWRIWPGRHEFAFRRDVWTAEDIATIEAEAGKYDELFSEGATVSASSPSTR
jgi:hypothetical protein